MSLVKQSSPIIQERSKEKTDREACWQYSMTASLLEHVPRSSRTAGMLRRIKSRP